MALGLMSCDRSSTSDNSEKEEIEIPEEPEEPVEPEEPEKPEEPEEPEEMKECYCLMDTLYGEWNWVGYYGAWGGYQYPTFKSIIKFGQNKDFSFFYEVFVEDTLFHTDVFQYLHIQPMYIKVDIKLPHLLYDYHNNDWYLKFGGIRNVSIDTLDFWDHSLIDCCDYLYVRKRKL